MMGFGLHICYDVTCESAPLWFAEIVQKIVLNGPLRIIFDISWCE